MEYKCTNVAFAAYLELKGFPLGRLEIERPGKGVFYFHLTEEDLNSIRCDWNNSVEAQFNDQLNRMKSLTY